MRAMVIGGGLAGLVAARALLTANPGLEIKLIERGDSLGGLLGGVQYETGGHYFDLGTHVFQETGHSTLDAILLGAVRGEDLLHYPVGVGDLAGSVFAGRLQSHSHFPDVRYGAVEARVVGALRDHIARGGPVHSINRMDSLESVAASRFGHVFAETVVGPVLSKAFGQPAAELAGFALLLPGWTRVVIDDAEAWEIAIADERYRALVAVPDQRELPPRLHHGRRSFYSRRHGSRDFIDGIADGLRKEGVEILCGTTIVSLDPAQRSITFIDPEGVERTATADLIVIATGVVGAAHLLGIDLRSRGFDLPMPHWVVNVVLEDPCLSNLCYLYGMDAGCDWYRVTNYRALTGNPNDRRMTIEVVAQPEVAPTVGPAHLVRQLHRVGLLASDGIEFSDVRRLATGFPSPSVRNMHALARLGAEITSGLPPGIILGGIGASAGLFFQNEVVGDLYRRVVALS